MQQETKADTNDNKVKVSQNRFHHVCCRECNY